VRFRLSLAVLILIAFVVAAGWQYARNEARNRTIHSAATGDPDDHPMSPSAVTTKVDAGIGSASIHFTQMQSSSGIDFRHETGNSTERPFPAVNGSGIAALDYDLDGRMDLYFATGRSFPLESPDTGTGNGLFLNRGGWRFQSVGAVAGVDHHGYSAGIAVGDVDSDGFPDIYIACLGPNILYRNNGDGTFQSVGEVAGINDPRWGTSAAFLDYDGDGHLDLYSCNYAQWTLESNLFCGNRTRGVRIFCNPDSVAPERHLLFHNEANGTFRETLQEAGIDRPQGRGQGVVTADVNLDGKIDLYVSNDLQPNFLFLNEGGGKFHDATDESGAAYDQSGRSQAGMGIDAADMNGDGLPELFVTNFEQDYNTLYENLCNGLFQDTSDLVGLAAASRPWVGWGTVLADFDGDGLRDVIVTNGHTDSNLAEMGRDTPYEQPALVWKNLGRRFELVANTAGTYFAERHPGRGLTVADLDNDGDHDIVVGHQDAAPVLLRNDFHPGNGTPSIQLQLIGRISNRDAVGALVTIHSESQITHHQITGGRSYLSAHDLRIIANSRSPVRMEIRWPSGIQTTLSGLPTGRRYVIVEPAESGQDPRVVELSETTDIEK